VLPTECDRRRSTRLPLDGVLPGSGFFVVAVGQFEWPFPGYGMHVPRIGYTLSCEEFGPRELVGFAKRAEETGFDFLSASDHFHPWVDRQGNSPFVWGVLGGVAQVTERVRVGTGVTCPTIRIHPAIVAHATATAAAMLPGRFWLGVGSGENLNEHVIGQRWPPVRDRLAMLEEAVALIRELWKGELTSHRGRHYLVHNARLYTLPEEPPAIVVAAGGTTAAEVAGRIGDGLVVVSPDSETIEAWRAAGGEGPVYGQVHVCWARSEEEGRRTALEWFPNIALPGELSQELPQPAHFEQAASLLSEDDMADVVASGPDPERHVEMIGRFVDAGCDHVYAHQIGPEQEAMLDFYEREVLPRVR
jgi:coenzyme F420-dependent glucose-6-phosphate dehydrogenase